MRARLNPATLTEQQNKAAPKSLERAVFSSQIQSSKFFFRHLHEDLNLDEIKNTLHSLAVNREMNLMNLIRP